MVYLAGDIGGTNTRLSLWEGETLVREKKYPSKEHKTLGEIVEMFVEKEKVSAACIGIAGPVRDNKCIATNLPWHVDGDHLSKILGGAPVTLLNDLVANAYGIQTLSKEEFYPLNPGKGSGNQALVSAGTGLGEVGIYFDGKEHHPFPSEGGHCDFAPRDEREVAFFHHMREKFGHVSYERAVSGPGLYNLYAFLVGGEPDITPVDIAKKGANRSCPRCREALEWFVSLYGAETGNVALKYLATGGVYLGGGIAPKTLETLKEGAFVEAFCDKGRFRDLLKQVPIWVVLNENTALLGSAHYAREKILF